MQKRYRWTKNFSNGDKYDGEATGENIKDGHGEYYWASTGAVYKGSWANDLPHGEGVMTVPGPSPADVKFESSVPPQGTSFLSTSGVSASDQGYVYEGSYERGQRSGQGTCRFTSGRVYTGEWKHDEMSGHGTLTGAPGGLDNFVEYVGPFLRGRRHGASGQCRYVNGDVYTGDWLAGRRHGQGRWVLAAAAAAGASPAPPPFSDTSSAAATSVLPSPPPLPSLVVAEYSGAFLQDAPCCTTGGEVLYTDGSRYTGGVAGLDVHREGRGELRLANGDIYVGGFKGNLREGEGTLKAQAHGGITYEGIWRADQLDGNVVCRRQHAGDVRVGDASAGAAAPLLIVAFSGPCQRNSFTGAGARMTFSDQSVYLGEVRDAQPWGRGLLESRRVTLRDGYPRQWFPSTASPRGGTHNDAKMDAGDGERWDVMLSRYEGNFVGGKPDGQGTGTFRLVAPLASSAPSAGLPLSVRVGPPAEFDIPTNGAKGLRINYRRNGTYTGTWSQGVPAGRGTWVWEDGDACEGDVAPGGLVHGTGKYQSAQATYEGSFQQGQPHGPDGHYHHQLTHDSYDGQWACGLFHGEGEFRGHSREANGLPSRTPSVAYKGNWRDGWQWGHGTERRTSAAASLAKDPVFAEAPTHYEGAFREGRYHGDGRLCILAADSVGDQAADPSTARVVYEGGFTNGARTGKGHLVLADGTTLEGPFDEGEPHGPGVVASFPSGLVYKGTYDHGCPSDTTGEISYPNGDRYQGEVESAAVARADGKAESGGNADPTAKWLPQRHGKGVFTFVEGNVLTCTWRHNVLHGEGVYKTYTGEVSTRHYVDGVVETRVRGAGGAAGGGGRAEDVFTAENELPNTLSEDALRKASAESKAPFPFVRKGTGGGTGAAASGNPNHHHHKTNRIHAEKGNGASPLRTARPKRKTDAPEAAKARVASSPVASNSMKASANTSSRGNGRATSTSSCAVRGGSQSPPPAVLPNRGACSSSPAASAANPGKRINESGAPPRGVPPDSLASAAPTTSPRTRRSPRPVSEGTTPRNNRQHSTVSSPTSPRTQAANGQLVRSKEEVRAAIAKRMSSRASLDSGGDGLSTELTTRRTYTSGRAGGSVVMDAPVGLVEKRPSLIEAFQEGIGRVDAQGKQSTVKTTLSATTASSDNLSEDRTRGGGRGEAVTLDAADVTTTYRAAAGAGEGEAGDFAASPLAPALPPPQTHRPRGPLKGQLRILMDEACAIRNSKEDEIHLLTEELRVLNEKIWQLRFTMSDGTRAAHTAAARKAAPTRDEQRLAMMMDERKGTVEKLNTLLQG